MAKSTRNRSRGLRNENLRLRKEISYLRERLASEPIETPIKTPIKQVLPESKLRGTPCPQCGEPLKSFDIGSSQVNLCNCGYRRRVT